MIERKHKREYSITLNLKKEHASRYLSFLEEQIRYQAEHINVFGTFPDSSMSNFQKTEEEKKLYLFRKTGEGFEIVFKGKPSLFMKESVGLTYIYFLLSHPNKPLSVEDLSAIRQSPHENGRQFEAAETSAERLPHKEYQAGDIKPVINKLNQLREEKQAANESGYYSKAEQLQYDIEELESYITTMRNTKSDPQLEKLRTGVRNAIANAIGRIQAYDCELGQYLQEKISTGYTCMYKSPPSEQVRWCFQ